FVCMARRALHFGNLGGMWEILDGGVAIGTSQNGMRAGRMFRSIDVDVFALLGLHPRLPMTRQTFLVGGRRGRSQSQINQCNQRRAHLSTLLHDSTAIRL